MVATRHPSRSDEVSDLLVIEGLEVKFDTPDGTVPAVREVGLSVRDGETLAIVGESGSGKSVTALSVLRLVAASAGRITAGRILFQGQDLLAMSDAQIRSIRGNDISMIFQEPMTSLNPLMKAGEQIAEVFRRHKKMSARESRQRTIEMLRTVRIPAPERRFQEYPHQLSGGMRQRVMIALALACAPKLLIADEPTTALDVTIQSQILDLIQSLRQQYGMSVMLITHDLGVVAETAQRVVVMYAGQIVETGDVLSLFDDPLHPYTHGLINAVPKLGSRTARGRSRLAEIKGSVPSLRDAPRGCAFRARCAMAAAKCETDAPQLRSAPGGRMVRCHFDRVARQGAR